MIASRLNTKDPRNPTSKACANMNVTQLIISSTPKTAIIDSLNLLSVFVLNSDSVNMRKLITATNKYGKNQ
jgi:hypothetical protein